MSWSSQPQIAIPPGGRWTPKGLWIPAYGTGLWTPNGMLTATNTAATLAALSRGTIGEFRVGDQISRTLNWGIPRFTANYGIVIGAVVRVSDTTAANQVSVSVGDSTVETSGLYNLVGQFNSTNQMQGSNREISGNATASTITGPFVSQYRSYNVIYVNRGLSSQVLWVNGRKFSGVVNLGTPSGTFGWFTIHGLTRGTGAANLVSKHAIPLAFYGLTDPGDEWMRAWTLDPWSIFPNPQMNRMLAALPAASAGFHARRYYDMIGHQQLGA